MTRRERIEARHDEVCADLDDDDLDVVLALALALRRRAIRVETPDAMPATERTP